MIKKAQRLAEKINAAEVAAAVGARVFLERGQVAGDGRRRGGAPEALAAEDRSQAADKVRRDVCVYEEVRSSHRLLSVTISKLHVLCPALLKAS